MGTSVRNLKGKGSTVAKMCCLVQRAIFIVIKLSPILLDTVPFYNEGTFSWKLTVPVSANRELR